MWNALSLPLLPGSFGSGVIVSFRVSFMGQKELFNPLLNIIIASYLKQYSSVIAQSAGAIEYTDCFSAEG